MDAVGGFHSRVIRLQIYRIFSQKHLFRCNNFVLFYLKDELTALVRYIKANEKQYPLNIKQHVCHYLPDHLFRHSAASGNLWPAGSCITNLVNHR